MKKPERFLSLVLLLVLLGCSGTPAATSTPTALPATSAPPVSSPMPPTLTPSPTVTAAATATPTPAKPSRPAGRLIFGQRTEPDTLHPLFTTMMGKDIINSALFAACTRLSPGGAWIPEMCTSVPSLENGGARWVGDGPDRRLEVTFHLRPDWKWHDGQPVTAADYVYTWKLALDIGLDGDQSLQPAQRAVWELIQDVTAPDPQTVVIRYHSQKSLAAAAAGQGPFPSLQADYQKLKETFPTGPAASPSYFALGSPLPEHILGSIPAKAQYESDYSRHKPIGNGAFIFKEWTNGSQIVMEANPNFPLGAPQIQTLIIRFYLSKDELLADLKKGALDGVTQDAYFSGASSINDLEALKAQGYRVVSIPVPILEHVDLNVTRFPFDDVRIRRALAYATNKQALLETMQAGWGTIQDGPLPSFSWAYSESSLATYPYSVDRAKAVLAEAGWDCSKSPCKKGSQTLTFTLSTTDRPDRKQLAQLLKGMWVQAGFAVDLQLIPGRGLYAAAKDSGPLTGGTFQAALYSWVYGEENQDMASWYSCQAVPSAQNGFTGNNFPRYCSQSVDQLIESASHSGELMADTAKLRSTLAEIQAAWTQDVPVIPLYNGITLTVVRSDLSGYALVPGLDTLDFWNAWMWKLNQ